MEKQRERVNIETGTFDLEKSAARFYCQVAAWVPKMFRNFYLAKSHKIASSRAATEARVKISTDSESLEFSKKLMYV